MRKQLKLPVLLAVAGLVLVFVHDYAYRRVDTGTGDYEFGGMVSHAGTDMIVVVVVLSGLAFAWERRR